MEKTTNLKLNKPTMADFVSESVEKVFGCNFDVIDEVVSDIITDLEGKADGGHTHPELAPKASPAFTGIPTAPTANGSTSTDQLATTKFVHSITDKLAGRIQFIVSLSSGSKLSSLVKDSCTYYIAGNLRSSLADLPGTLSADLGSIGASTTTVFAFVIRPLNLTAVAVYQHLTVIGVTTENGKQMPTKSIEYVRKVNIDNNGDSSPIYTPDEWVKTINSVPTAAAGTSDKTVSNTEFVVNAIAQQAHSFTAADQLETLTSGEKLTISMGKIMLAITNLISHLANTSNPHGVTLAQLGAAAASHKHSASDITSGTLPASRGGTGKTSLSALATAIFASPAFTGVPTAPTAESGTSTTQVATTAFVQQESAKDWFFIAEHNGASDNLYSSNTATVSDISQVNNFNNLAITVTYSGTIRISALLNYSTTSTRYIYLSVYKNGSLQKTFYNNGNSGAQTQNINISKGDILTFEYGFVSATSGNPSTGSARFDLLGVLNKRSSTGLSISES